MHKQIWTEFKYVNYNSTVPIAYINTYLKYSFNIKK